MCDDLASEYVSECDAASGVGEEDMRLRGADLGSKDRAVPGQGEYRLVVLINNLEAVWLEGRHSEVWASTVAADRVLDVEC